MKIALAQVAAGPDPDANVQKGLDCVDRAKSAGASLICFPEMAFRPFFPQFQEDPKYFEWAESIPGPTTGKFADKAKETGLGIILNMYEVDDQGRRFDCSPILGPDGSLLGRSRMVHIAEEPGYWEKYYYTPGDTGFPVYEANGIKFGIAICYDRHFPEHLRALVLQGAQVIFVPTACDMSDPLEGYDLEMQGAAFSNLVYIAVVNRAGKDQTLDFSGRSILVDPDGKVTARAKPNEDDLVVADLDLSKIERARKERPFLRDRRPEIYGMLSR